MTGSQPAQPLLQRRFVRYLLAGVVNTAFGFAVYAVALLANAPVWLALLIANVAGVAFNFVTTGGYVFRNLVVERFPRFAAAYVLVYLVNLQLIEWLLLWVPGKIAAQAILTLPMALFSYAVMKKLVFSAGSPAPERPGH